MSNIEFIARKGDKIKVSAPSAVEAVRKFLGAYSVRSFTVMEFRDGKHVYNIGASDNEDSYFNRHFKNRAEALQFVQGSAA